MPFKSKAQQRWMYKNKPDIAKRWEDKYGISKKMPMHVAKKKIVKKKVKSKTKKK